MDKVNNSFTIFTGEAPVEPLLNKITDLLDEAKVDYEVEAYDNGAQVIDATNTSRDLSVYSGFTLSISGNEVALVTDGLRDDAESDEDATQEE